MSGTPPSDLWCTVTPGESLWDGRPRKRYRLTNGLVGRIIAGRYRLGRLIDDARLCGTYEAHDIETREPVSIELLAWPEGAGPPSRVQLRQETRRLVDAKHVGLREVRSIGVEGGAPFIVAGPVGGEVLRDRLTRSGPTSVADSLAIAMQVIDALAVAHAAGLVHGNLKPEKIRLGATPTGAPLAMVMGLGIMTLFATTPDVDTRGVGTPPYLAPEQLGGVAAPDELSDVWRVGLLVYEMLTGKRAFDGSSSEEVGRRIAQEPPGSLRRLCPDVPLSLQIIVGGVLTRPREQRLGLRDLRKALAEVVPVERKAPEPRSPPKPARTVVASRNPCDDDKAPTDLDLDIETDLDSL